MGVFRFKEFDVVNERSAMKVNTDGVLLGAAMTILPGDRRFLDIGTGTGTIALMAAQRASDCVRIDAIDVDEASADEAGMNFRNSPWADCLYAYNLPLDKFGEQTDAKYDLIFSNPPYFEDSLTAPNERKSTARHTTDGLSYRDILEFARERLTESGRVSFVLPAEQEAALCRYARMCGLHLFNILRVRTVERKQPARIIAEFSRERCENPKDEILTIQNKGQYTREYLSLTHNFYLFA
ncbi:MAG: methyltransferase [Bacteroidales bacterium]|nr:methyltransferase [Bacteroidales bacterium]